MNFSEKLQLLRKGKNLSQEDFAEIMGVSRQSVSKWELGQSYPDIEKLIEISNYFNASLDRLLKDELDVKEESVTEIKVNTWDKRTPPRKTRIKLMLLASLGLSSSCLCFSMLYIFHSTYQAVCVGAMCVTTFILSLLLLFKVRRLGGIWRE